MNLVVSQTILLVEDDENDRFFTKLAADKAGLAGSLQIAEDGAEAIDYLSGQGRFADRALHPMPALILLDLKLPRVMGIDVLKWIRNQPLMDTIVVIILSASDQRSDIQMACSLGANSYLVKPSSPLDLDAMIGCVKQYWLGLNQPTATKAKSARSRVLQ